MPPEQPLQLPREQQPPREAQAPRQPPEPQPPRAQPPREPHPSLDPQRPLPGYQPPDGPAPRRRRSAEPPVEQPADEGLDLFQPPPGPARQHPGDESPTEIIHLVDDDVYDDDYPDDYLEDDYQEDERAEPEYIEPTEEPEDPPRRRRKPLRWVAALAVIALIGAGAWFGVTQIFGYDDYQGDGEADVLVQVGEGDSTNAVGRTLADAGVVASAKAFVKASADNSKVLTLQPGYYVVKTKMSGAAAVAMLTEPAARVGMLQIRAGTQLDDITQPDNSVTPGVFTLLSKASCANLNGKSTCVSTDDLRKTAESADLAAMGVPDWAASAVAQSTDARRIEGLVAPGVYDVKPGWTAEQLLGDVLKSSASKIQSAGLAGTSTVQGQNAYQVLTIASLIEREAVKQDFPKISRVIYNRLASRDMQRLQLDSTVNYLLDKPVVTTTDADRTRPGPYNTYVTRGLPPTPIGSPSSDAIQAALQPPDGDWLYFVKCEKNGLSCFAATLEEHNHNKDIARQNGAY